MTTVSEKAWSAGHLWRMKLAHLLEELQLLETQLNHVTAQEGITSWRETEKDPCPKSLSDIHHGTENGAF